MTVTTIRQLGLTNTIRDYMIDNRTTPLTITAVMQAVNQLRLLTGEPETDDGAVRRAIETMVSKGFVTKVNQSKPFTYQYAEGRAVPADHLSYSQRMVQASANPDMRQALHDKITKRMGDVTGRTPTDPKTKIGTPPEDPGPPPVTIVDRPNGTKYRVRSIGSKPDVEVLRILRDNEVSTLLYGPPGTGKTSLVEAAFQLDLILFPGDENTTVDDLFGTLVPDGNGSWDWVDGPATSAMKNGQVLFLDDITLINGRVLGALYPAMDGRDEIVIKTHMVDKGPDGKAWPDGMRHPEVVKAQPGFFIIGAHNPGTNGAILSEALSSRFQFQMEIDSDLDLAAAAGVPYEIMKVARTLQTSVTEHHITWMPQLRELFQAKRIHEVTGSMEIALGNLAGLAPEDDREYVLQKIRSTAGMSVERLRIGKQL